MFKNKSFLNFSIKSVMATFSLSVVFVSLFASFSVKADQLPASCTQPFPDVACTNNFASWIKDLKDAGVVSGFSNGNFRGGQPVSRGEMSKFVFNGLGYANNISCPEFNDVNNSDTFYVFTQTLKCEDIIHGYAGNLFLTNKTVTRAQAAKYVVLGLIENGTISKSALNSTSASNYTDVPNTNEYYEYISVSRDCILTPRFSNRTFNPNDTLNRNQMAMMVSEARERVAAGGC